MWFVWPPTQGAINRTPEACTEESLGQAWFPGDK